MAPGRCRHSAGQTPAERSGNRTAARPASAYCAYAATVPGPGLAPAAALAILSASAPQRLRRAPAPSGYPVIPQPPIVNALMKQRDRRQICPTSAPTPAPLRRVHRSPSGRRRSSRITMASGAGSWRAIINGWDVPGPAAQHRRRAAAACGALHREQTDHLPDHAAGPPVRHAYGMNHVGHRHRKPIELSATNIINCARQYQVGLALVRWLQYEYGIPTANIAGHGTANDSPLFARPHRPAQRPHRLGTLPRWAGSPAIWVSVLVKDGGPGPHDQYLRTPVRPTRRYRQSDGRRRAEGGLTRRFNCADGPPASQALNSIYYPTPPTPAGYMGRRTGNGDISALNSQQTHPGDFSTTYHSQPWTPGHADDVHARPMGFTP